MVFVTNLEYTLSVLCSFMSNLVMYMSSEQVGKETVYSTDDPILKQDMPQSLQRVEEASHLLEDASRMLKADPYSGPARKKLIEGARGTFLC